MKIENIGNKQEKLKIQWVDIDDLKPSEYNPRKWTEKEINDLKESIKRFGIVDPLIVNSAENRKNIVIGGHFRLTILKELGYKKVPVVYVNIPDIKKEKELNLRLNKNLGEWNIELLANFDEELLKEVGFESEELDKIFDLKIEDSEKDDYVPEVKKTNIKYGDIFKLGNHRLMCGDATKKEDVEKLMNGEKADMVFTDPPYGINLNTDFSNMVGIGRGNRYEKIIGDDKPFDYRLFGFLNSIKEQFWWGADYYVETLPNFGKNGSWFVWDKTESGISPNSEYEKQFGSNFELCWSRVKHKRQIIRCLWKGFFGLSKEDVKKRLHPTQKPVALCEWFIKKFSKRNDIVLDLFGGSGSTLIACEKLNRRCYMMEIEPIYCQVIIDRWEKFTGKKAKKISEK
jgi:DNA modification methylase